MSSVPPALQRALRLLPRFGAACGGTVLSCGLLLVACTGDPQPAIDSPNPPHETTPHRDKVPVTTRSDAARELYLEGRRLSDHLRPAEARQLYLEALSLDRHFALAHLALAESATSARGFFESMARAVALAEVVSEGERLIILARDAGVRGVPAEQIDRLRRLVELYPNDERAHALLGDYYADRQEYERAIPPYELAVEVAPDFSPAYNRLGYTYRALGRYDEAEAAFRRYIALLPDEPNPYDSFAELLMKTGRFEESIAQYQRALELAPEFGFSYIGQAHDLVLLGRFDEARSRLRALAESARDIGQRRRAIFWEVLSYVHEGDTAAALAGSERLLELAETNADPAAMASDLELRGTILLEDGQAERAEEAFVEAVERIATADVPSEVVEAQRRDLIYWKSRLALATGRLADASQQLDAYRQRVAPHGVPAEERRVRELAGELALLEGDPTRALAELAEADRQDPRVLLLCARALRASGRSEAALRMAEEAAHFNELSVSYAFVRAAAHRLASELRSVS
ncbi:MAG: tetratricopeptide repeat protein [Thermoanaerobaculia bacterium]|nr:tetratricopeptide repeat protein [Thermoanaerobaculia bacterium]